VSAHLASAPAGLLGGTFDPVHAGHCQLGRDAQSALGLARLDFVPAGQPWQKAGTSAAAHRVAMLRLALAPERGWNVDLREVERAGPSYTIDTLLAVRAERGARLPLVWILGYDQLRRLDTWHRWTELLDVAHLAYARRAGAEAALPEALADFVAVRRGSAADLARRPAGSIVEFAMQPVDCSATAIRRDLAAGNVAAAAPFLAPPVLAYIHSHQLYLAVHGH